MGIGSVAFLTWQPTSFLLTVLQCSTVCIRAYYAGCRCLQLVMLPAAFLGILYILTRRYTLCCYVRHAPLAGSCHTYNWASFACTSLLSAPETLIAIGYTCHYFGHLHALSNELRYSRN